MCFRYIFRHVSSCATARLLSRVTIKCYPLGAGQVFQRRNLLFSGVCHSLNAMGYPDAKVDPNTVAMPVTSSTESGKLSRLWSVNSRKTGE